MSEMWRSVDGSPGFAVSTEGRIRSPRGRILRPQSNGRYGYLAVQLGRKRREYVHRLVAVAFIGPVDGMDVDHRDGDTSHNAARNLRVMTHAENLVAQRERKPRCARGHSFADAIWRRNGRRMCRTCTRMREQRRVRLGAIETGAAA